ncbi:sulfite exporter TauE/SafE family protein [Paraburkholderia edwinii]|uniref:Nickel/cobalt efflux system n=1 Tax=Paraburkholderia edwinii TaxID=2861782 RepID=A0ABX8ULJ5_9BURK|nr:sulfite exporter TauE/SafE family protein [Paraburkholderia edwinii]QYD68150.1 sulfite exporter TauE/SafE family protein [Paraburkholderia edwinii]
MLTFNRSMLGVLLALCIAAITFAWITPANAATSIAATSHVDVFGRPVQAPSTSATANDSNASSTTGTTPVAEPAHKFVLPEFARKVLAFSIVWQGRLNARLADAAADLHRSSTAFTWLTLIGLAFAYGVLHAVGPGHGKLVTGTYLGSRNTRVAEAVSLAAWTATVQAMSAIVLVFGAAWFAKQGMSNVLSNAASLDVTSCLLLCLAGGWTIYTTLARHDCCDDAGTLKLVPDERSIRSQSAESLDEPAYLGNKLQFHARRSSSQSMFARSKRSTASQILATGFASGVRPCVGSIFVLIAAIAAHTPFVGIAATFAIGAGVALTVTLFGLGAIGANRLISARGIRIRSKMKTAQRVFAVAGALVIVLFGAAQAALILTGYLEPAIT